MATLAYTLRSLVKDSVPGLKVRTLNIVGDTDIPATTGYVKSLASLGFEDVYGCTAGITSDGVYVVVGVKNGTDMNFKYFNLDDGVQAAVGEDGVDGTSVDLIIFGR